MQYISKFLNGDHLFLEISDDDGQNISELEQFKNENNISIGLNNISLLTFFPNVKRLIITSGTPNADVSKFLEALENLRELKLDYVENEQNTEWEIDISKSKKLEYLFARSSYDFRGIDRSETLKSLIVYNWYSEDLTCLGSSVLDTLCICKGELRSLNGIEKVPLKILTLSYLPKLIDVSQVKETSLTILEIDNCNKIIDFEKYMPVTLEYLMIYGKNKVKSGNFVNKIKALRRVIIDIQIEDGDLSAFDSLESAILLTNRKKYNRCNKQLPKADDKFIIPSIPEWRYLYSGRKI